MKTFLEEFGLVGSAGQSRVTFPCSFDVSTHATQSLLQDGPEGPSVTSAPGTPDLLSASDSGASSTDNITSSTTPGFRVALPAAAIATDTITLYRAGSVSIDTAVLDGTDISNGYVDMTASTLSEAAHTITATCTNGVGESAASSGLVVTVDTSAASAPTAIIVTPADQGSGETQTENTQPTFRISLPGNAVATDVVTLEIDAVDDATATLDGTDISNGYVDIQSASGLADNATYDISAFITDLAGNAGASSSAVEVEVGTAPAAGAIPAVIYDGVGDYLLHTGGPAGAVDGTTGTFVWSGRFNSDGSAMTLFDIPGTVPVLLQRQSDNTIDFEVGTAGAVCSASTTAVASSLGFLIVLASFTGTTANLYVIHAAGTITGAPTAGSGASADLTADWYLGADGGAANFLDAETAMWWADDGYIDFSDSDNREEFWDSTNDLLRDPGSDGSNPSGAQPLVCHQNVSVSHVTNTGSGGDADGGSNSGNGTSPGAFAEDYDTSTSLTVTYIGRASDTTSTVSTYTFVGEDIGTAASDRFVAVKVLGEVEDSTLVAGDITCTIGGVSATAASRFVRIGGGGGANGAYGAVFYLLVTTGTTADIVVDCNSKNQHNCHIAVYNITGNASISVTDTIGIDGNTDTINVSSGGIYVAGTMNTPFTSITWTDGPSGSDYAAWTGEHYVLGGSGSTSGTNTVTGSSGYILCAASFEAAAVVSVTNTHNATDGGNTGTTDFTSVAYGDAAAGSFILVAIMTSCDLGVPGASPTVTLSGDAMSEIASASVLSGATNTRARTHFYVIEQADMTDDTVTSGTISVAYGGQHRGKSISVYRVLGHSATPSDTLAVDAENPLQGTLTYPDGGAVFACAKHRNADSGTTWTNITGNYVSEIFGRLTSASEFPTTAGDTTVDITFTNQHSTAAALSAVAFPLQD